MIDWLADLSFVAAVLFVVWVADSPIVTAVLAAFAAAMMWTLATGGRWP